MKHSPHLTQPAEYAGAPEGVPLEQPAFRNRMVPTDRGIEAAIEIIKRIQSGAPVSQTERFMVDEIVQSVDRQGVDGFGGIGELEEELLVERFGRNGHPPAKSEG